MAKKIILSLVVSLFLVSGAFAGWTTVETSALENLNAVYFVDENTGYAVGDSGRVVKIIVSGTSYSYISQLVGTVGAYPNFRDVIFPSSTEGYVVGDNGAFYKTTDGYGGTYTKQTLPAAIQAATIESGSFSGTRRAFTAWTGSASYLLYSEDSGATFAVIEIPGFEVHGVALTTTATWEWGKISNVNQYGLVRDSSTLIFPEGQTDKKVNNIFFLPSGEAVAVGDSGVFLTKEADAASNNWKIVQTGLTKNLNSSSFFISPSVGWVVADGGKIYYTKNGGTSFYEYPDSNSNLGTSKLRDISIITVGTVAHAYVVGDSGTIVTLASPSISAVSPNSRKQGWVGTIEVTGSEFLNPLTFRITDEGITVFSATAESASKFSSVIIINPAAAVGTWDAIVTNPDGTTVTSTAAFAVTANTGNVTIENTWFDGMIPPLTSEAVTISPAPTISFEVISSAYALNALTLNAKILFKQGGTYKKIYYIPQGNITLINDNKAKVTYSIPAADAFTVGAATVELYAEDSVGNPGWRGLTVEVGSDTPSGDFKTEFYMKGAVKADDKMYFAPSGIMKNNSIKITGGGKPGYAIPPAFKGTFTSAAGGDIVFQKIFRVPVKAQQADVKGAHFTFEITQNDLAGSANDRAAMIYGIFTIPDTNEKIGSVKFLRVPQEPGVNWGPAF